MCVWKGSMCVGAGEMCMYVAGECVWGEREGGGGVILSKDAINNKRKQYKGLK